VTENVSSPGEASEGADPRPIEVDGSVARPARVYDYVLGGKDNFAADRDVAEHAAAAKGEGGIDHARAAVRADREFLGRAVRYLVTDAGIRQFLDIGTGIPHGDNIHEIAQKLAPESRIVYVDDDAVVLAHAHRLRKSTPEGATAYVDADPRQVDKVLRQAPDTLDMSQPIAVTLFGTLHHVLDEDEPHKIVSRLVDAVPSGSYLAISHLTADIMTEAVTEAAKRINESGTGFRLIVRSGEAILRFFDGLDMVEPGLVTADAWRPDGASDSGGWEMPYYVAIGRKP
jgi:nucleotide-binding universal stress UspA family protein